MFKRKGLFWYDTHQRFFDWSTNFEGALFGYQNTFLDKRIKYHLKKRSLLLDPSKDWQAWLKNQFNFWRNQFPDLNSYHFYLVSDIGLRNFLTERVESVYSEAIETTLEKDFIVFPHDPNSKKDHILITDSYCQFQEMQELNKMVTDNKKKILFLNTTFPNLSGINIHLFDYITVGGSHPFSLGGHKLLLSKEKIEEFHPDKMPPENSPQLMDINLWKSKLYLDGIKYYYKKSHSKNFEKRKKLLDQSLNQLNTIAKLQVLPTKAYSNQTDKSTPMFYFKLIVNSPKKIESIENLPDPVVKHFPHRYFFRNLTLVGQDNCFYIHLPINFDIDHFKNKTKYLLDFFKLWS